MAAQTNASAIPVLPLVASTIVVRPGSIRPSRSAASIIATPIRSLTLPPGIERLELGEQLDVQAARSIAASPTIGVRPTRSAMLVGTGGIGPNQKHLAVPAGLAQMWYIGAPAARISCSATAATVASASTSPAAWAASANTPVAPTPSGPSSSSTISSTVTSAAGRAKL